MNEHTDLSSRRELVDLLFGDNNRPRLSCLAEHLLRLEVPALLEDHGPDVLSGGGRGVEDLLDSVDEGDSDLRRVVVGAALDSDLAGGVGLLGLAGVALSQELHARRDPRVESVELDPHLREELQHFEPLRLLPDQNSSTVKSSSLTPGFRLMKVSETKRLNYPREG